jgi:hypothetical protein
MSPGESGVLKSWCSLRPAQIAVHEQHAALLPREGRPKVRGRGGLAFAGGRAGHHQERGSALRQLEDQVRPQDPVRFRCHTAEIGGNHHAL